jgi:hypothetical protein
VYVDVIGACVVRSDNVRVGYEADGIEDGADYRVVMRVEWISAGTRLTLLQAMESLGFDDKLRASIRNVIGAILHIGQLQPTAEKEHVRACMCD